MQDLNEIINEATDAREVKRAVSVKMGQQGFSAAQICQVLNVSPQYVSKWKGQYGVVYQSKQSYYEFLEAGGMSYHRSEKVNPKRDAAQVLGRREEIKKNWRRTEARLSGES